MKRIQILFNAILCVAVIVLYILFFTSRNHSNVELTQIDHSVLAPDQLPIAFLNTDSLLLNYVFAQEASDRLQTKQEDARLKLNSQAKTLQQELSDFQRKLDNNAFLSRERAEAEQKRLIQKQQDLEDLENQLSQEIMEENRKFNLQLADTLMNFLQLYNADNRFQLIFSNNSRDNILMATPQYDITAEVVDALNKRYSKK